MKHENSQVRLLSACCLVDIMRAHAPETPFDPRERKALSIPPANLPRRVIRTPNCFFREGTASLSEGHMTTAMSPKLIY